MDKMKLLRTWALNGCVDRELLDQHHQNRDVLQPLETLPLDTPFVHLQILLQKNRNINKISHLPVAKS
jgi:hypothetical protein